MMNSIIVWLLESSLLILMILGIRKFFTGKVPYRVIYALWGIVLLRLVLPINLFPTHLSLENLFVGEQAVSEGQGQSAAEEKSATEVMHNGMTGESEKNAVQKVVFPDNVKGDIQKKVPEGERENLYKEAEKVENANRSTAMEGEVAVGGDSEGVAYSGNRMEGRVLFVLWACVAFVVLCWVVFSNLRFLRRVKKNRILLGRRGRVKVYAADVAGSCLYGVFHPSVYLPVFLVRSCLGKSRLGKNCLSNDCLGNDCQRTKKEKDEKEKQGEDSCSGAVGILPGFGLSQIKKHPQLSQVLVHEFTHYRHRDHIWAMVRTAVLAVYWFHPLVWLAVRLSGKDAELYCDEATIQQIGEEKRFDYGEMLIHLSGSAGQERYFYSAVFMSRRGKDMEKRIRAISERKQYSRWLAVPLVILVLATVGVTCSRAVSSSGQPDNTVNLENNVDTTKTTEELAARAKEEAARQENLKESLEIYQSFLEEHKEDRNYRYYSLAELAKGQYVLLTADHTMVVEDGEDAADFMRAAGSVAGADTDEDYFLWSNSHCQVHCIVSGEVVSCGEIACSSSGEWIHVAEAAETENRVLVTDTHHSVSHYSLKEGETKLTMDIREEYKEGQEAEFGEWMDGMYAAPSVIFFTNPAVGKGKKNEPQALELSKDTMDYYAKRILSPAGVEMKADVTGDGVKDTIRVDYDKVEAPAADMENSVTVVSGSSGKEIYGLNANLVHDSWKGVFLYKKKGHASLMTWQPAMYQGIANYQWEIFDLSEDGRETILAQDSFSFDLNHVKEDDPEKLERFVEKLNSYLKDAFRLVLISDGKHLEGARTDYEFGGHYKTEYDAEGDWSNEIYSAELELKAMREALASQQ